MPALYRYEEIREVHLELTSRCQAACPMCGRNLHGGRRRANVLLDEITLDAFRAWFPDDFLAQLDTLVLCGNFGDPIIARDCVPICAHVRSRNSEISISLHTNGAARNAEFWRDLARTGVTVRFGIDGATAATHERYRRNTRFATVLDNAATFIEAGGRAMWVMLVFRHNEAETGAAEAMATAMGFRQIVIKSTNRFSKDHFDVEDDAGRVIDRLEPSARLAPTGQPVEPDSAQLATCPIECRVARSRSVYVAADGLVFPCCFLGQLVNERPGAPDTQYHRPWMTSRVDSLLAAIAEVGIERLDLHHARLEDIVNRQLPRFARRWAPGPDRLEQCARVCGRLDAAPLRPIGGETETRATQVG